MRGILIGLALAIALASPGPDQARAQAQNQAQPKIGIVLMHGKQGKPQDEALGGLAVSLETAGYLVDLPEMCWSQNRLYDATFVDCLADVDAAVARLKAKGARAIVVAGLSLGGSGALGYGARRSGLAGIIAMAPTPNTHFFINEPGMAEDFARARQLIADGRGDQRTEFTDWTRNNMGYYKFTASATPRIFISFIDPDGPANMLINAGHLKAPLLLVSGSNDPSQAQADRLFAAAPANPLNRHVTVGSNHMGTAQAGIGAVLDWLGSLSPAR